MPFYGCYFIEIWNLALFALYEQRGPLPIRSCREGSRKIFEAVRFNQYSILTLRIRKEMHGQL